MFIIKYPLFPVNGSIFLVICQEKSRRKNQTLVVRSPKPTTVVGAETEIGVSRQEFNPLRCLAPKWIKYRWILWSAKYYPH